MQSLFHAVSIDPATQKQTALFHAAYSNPANPVKDHYPAPNGGSFLGLFPHPAEKYVDAQIAAMERLRPVFSFEAGMGDAYNEIAVDLAHLVTLDRLRGQCDAPEDASVLCARGEVLAAKLQTSVAAQAKYARALLRLEALAEPLAEARAMAENNLPFPINCTSGELRQLIYDYRQGYQARTLTVDLVKRVLAKVETSFPGALTCDYRWVPNHGEYLEDIDLDEAVEHWNALKTLYRLRVSYMLKREVQYMVKRVFTSAAVFKIT